MSLGNCIHRRAVLCACAAVAVLAVALMPARATTNIEADLTTMARDADAVMHAVVERSGTQMAYNASAAPWSVAELRVLHWWKGSGGRRIWVRDPGAVWANGGRPVIGAAIYRAQEEVLVFLREDEGGYYRTHNLAAGKLLLRREGEQTVVEQDLGDVSILEERGSISQSRRRVLGSVPNVLSQLARALADVGR